ncbi:MAG: MFS transporter [Candidatus Methylomirabilales bacterium]
MPWPPALQRKPILGAFCIPSFWRVWLGSMYWYSARWMDLFVLQWQVLVMTDSAFQVTLVGFYRMLPMFVLGLLTGLIADRYDRRKVLLAAQLWNAAVSAALAVLALTGRLALWHLAVLVTALGCSWALDLPSRRSYIYDMMGPRRVVNAMALDHVGMDGAKMLGPVLGGLLWPVIGLGGCLLLLTVGYVVNFWIYLGLPASPPARPSRPGPIVRNLAEGLRYVLAHPVILGVLAITVVMNLLAFPYQQVAPVVAKKALDLGPQLAGLLLAADGLGAFTASLLIAARHDVKRKGLAFILGSAVFTAGVLLFSFSRWFGLSFLLLFVAGGGAATFATFQSSTLLVSASDSMRGRAMGTLMLAIGFGPLGALLIGGLASAVGAPLAITLMAGTGALLLALLIWKATGLRRFRTG